jgi:hypothetical protein
MARKIENGGFLVVFGVILGQTVDNFFFTKKKCKKKRSLQG